MIHHISSGSRFEGKRNSARVTHHSSRGVVVEGLKEGLLKKRKEGSDAAGGEEELA